MIPPRLPFPGYKWRWATLTPTEGLNLPPIFLGVIRVLRENEGRRPNSPEVRAGLAQVEREVAGRVDTRLRLVRPLEERDLFRNSQQYWKALGVLRETRGISLTPFGQAVADGRITRDEFSAAVVSTLELPNRVILRQDEVSRWDQAGVRIRPLVLVLEIMRSLGSRFGDDQAFLTTNELIRIVIPLAGDASSVLGEFVDSIVAFRNGTLDLAQWPDCAPEDNDARMAREFLLFLANYGYCLLSRGDSNSLDRFALRDGSEIDVNAIAELPAPVAAGQIAAIDQIRVQGIAASVERGRVVREILDRPSQARFRRSVLRAYGSQCAVTGERMPETLEAAHIIPVEYRGADLIGNGLCLRSDIHSLFDSGHLRIRPFGQLVLSDQMRASASYRDLPINIQIPGFVLPDALEWRWKYQ